MKKLIAGLAALAAAAFALPASATDVAITFDDLGAHSALPPGVTRVQVAADIIAALKAAGAPQVYGFINAVQNEREPASAPVLDMWRKAGFPLANHTFTHMSLNQNPLADWQADFIKNEPELQKHMAGADWRWVRFPFLHEGDTPQKRTQVREWLAGRNYKIASVTLDFSDWAYNETYARCMAKKDETAVARMEAMWLKGAADSLAYERALSKAVFGREVPMVLLMHIGAFDARMMPRLLDLYRREGVRLATLDEVERDPFYAADYKPAATPAPLTFENAAKAKGVPVPLKTWSIAELETLCR
ncbi:polysaccharide deacetylase family protein [Phenylobacterium deserti]|uniref:Chitooligosaccharide deacetylase n=1 Tax=Phenylobacterium deserti TaxID=1914756 RepID=A0A328AQT2_9CAUL|nr:polysaccharide deacetylase family protein [Phenylobacterium deserti]RAK56987.1 polysaccharide deacetylase [Phenylobacterium deserti]